MSGIRIMALVFFTLGLLMACQQVVTSGSRTKDAVRISVHDLKKMLGDPQLVIVDVRDPLSWSKSYSKILGALRRDPRKFKSWAGDLPKGKTIVLYCA